MLTKRAQIHGLKLFSLPFFYGLRVLVALLLSRRGRDVLGETIEHRNVPEAKAMVFELRSLEERRSVMQGCWELLKDWPARFLATAARAELRRADFERSLLIRPFWIDSVMDQLPGTCHRQLSDLEVATIGNWLLASGNQPTWALILKASAVGVPVRVRQPALKAFLSGRSGQTLA